MNLLATLFTLLAFGWPRWVPGVLRDRRIYFAILLAVLVYVVVLIVKRLMVLRPKSSPEAQAKALVEAGNYQSAIQLYTELEQYDKAALAYIKQGNHYGAAKMYVRQGDFGRAGTMFEKSGQLGEAADAFRRAGQLEDAARVYELEGDTRQAIDCRREMGDPPPEASSRAIGIASDGARKAIETPAHRPIAAPFVSQRPITAPDMRPVVPGVSQPSISMAEMGAAAGSGILPMPDPDDGPAQPTEALLAEAQELRRKGKFKEAAKIYGAMRDYVTAAELLEEGEYWAQAASCYKRLEQWEKSAICYLKAKDDVLAIRQLNKLKDNQRAATFLQDLREFYYAGRFYEAVEKQETALGCYEQVSAFDKNVLGALQRAVVIGSRLGRLDATIKRLSMMTESRAADKESLVLFQLHAQALMERGDLAAAESVYRKLVDAALIAEEDIPDECRIAEEEQKTRFDGGLDGTGAAVESAMSSSDPQQTSAPSAARRGILAGGAAGDSRTRLPDGVLNVELEQSMVNVPAPKVEDSFSLITLPTDERYELRNPIGKGGVGEVYLAYDKLLSREVVMKFLQEQFSSDEMISKYFIREARVAASLNHVNIVTTHDIGIIGGRPFISMEYLRGKTLKMLLRLRKKPLTVDLGRRIVMQLCAALTYAHKNSVVHRDVKAENVMVTEEGTLKLMDFGLAKVLSHTTHQATMFVGTPVYMAPEMITGEFLDHRVDIYAVGIMLFLMFTGRFPFDHDQVLAHHLNTMPPDPRTINGELPEALSLLILKCIEKDRDHRFATVADLKKAFAACG